MTVLCALCLYGCGATLSDMVQRRAAHGFPCAPAQVRVQQTDVDEYEATGCGMRAVFVCTRKRHIRASGATSPSCTRVLQHPLSAPGPSVPGALE